MGSRKEPRKTVNYPATIAGMDMQGRSFLDAVKIRDISARGILVEGVRAIMKPGDTVVVRYGENKGRFRVMWMKRQNGSVHLKQVGLEHLLSTTIPWAIDVPLPAHDAFRHPRKRVRREFPRFRCEIPVELRFFNSKAPQWGSTADVCEGGCFVKTSNILPVGSEIEVALWLDHVKVWIRGLIVTNLCGFGTGIHFSSMSLEVLLRLREFLQKKGQQIPDRRYDGEEDAIREQELALGHAQS